MHHFYVRCFRRQGVLIPRHNFLMQDEAMGLFVIKEGHDEETRRTMRVATLMPHYLSRGAMPLPLYDATVISAGEAWTVTGFERVECGYKAFQCYAQSWYMLPLHGKVLKEMEVKAGAEAADRLFPTAPPSTGGE